MKVYLARPNPDPNWTILMTVYEPRKKVTDIGDIHWEFDKVPARLTPNAMSGLGIDDDELPKPGECVVVSIGEK